MSEFRNSTANVITFPYGWVNQQLIADSVDVLLINRYRDTDRYMDIIADCTARGDTRRRALARRQPCPGTSDPERRRWAVIWDAAAVMEHAAGVWVVTRLHGYNKWCCVMRLTSQSALLHSRILNCWDLSATPQPRYQLRHDQNSNSILSRVDIVKIFIHC